MTLREFIEQAGQSAMGWLVVTTLAGFTWLIRRIFTNQRQIEITRLSMETLNRELVRDREEYRVDIAEIKAAQKEMGRDIKELFKG